MGIGKKLAEIIEEKGTNVNELAGITGITPSEDKWEVLEKQLEALSDDELNDLEEYVQFLLWKKLQKKYPDRQG